MSKFIAVSKQATKLDKTRILLETRVQEVRDKCKRWPRWRPRPKKKLRN